MDKISILLADDSITIQKVVGIIFGSDEYTLHIADNGKDALQMGKELKPDLFLIDAVMPGMDGYQLCEAIRNEPTLSSRPVLLLTGSFEPFDEEKARSCGADDHILKPFESQLIVDKVQELYRLGQQRLAEQPDLNKREDQLTAEAPPPFFELDPGRFEEEPDPATEGEEPPFQFESVFSDNSSLTTDTELTIDNNLSPQPQPQPVSEPVSEPEPLRLPDDPWGAFIQQPVVEDQQVESVLENVNFDLAAQLSEEPETPAPEEPKVEGFTPSWIPVEEQSFEFSEEVAAIPDGLLKGEPASQAEVALQPEEPVPLAESVAARLDDEQIREIVLSASRETVERIVWEVVPDLAESMVKEAIRRITEK